jgi:FtsH-binding integral membrane protein
MNYYRKIAGYTLMFMAGVSVAAILGTAFMVGLMHLSMLVFGNDFYGIGGLIVVALIICGVGFAMDAVKR